MRSLIVFVGACALLLAGATPVAGNSDPHRFPFGFGTFDLSECGYTIHFDTWSRMYATPSADGSVLTVRGAAGGTLTAHGKSLELNLSGPMTLAFLPDGGYTQVSEGLGILWANNFTDFGLPSNIVVASGLASYSATADGTVLEMPRVPHVMVDVCAALG